MPGSAAAIFRNSACTVATLALAKQGRSMLIQNKHSQVGHVLVMHCKIVTQADLMLAP